MYIYVDDYQTLRHNEERSLMEVTWSQATSQLKVENYINKMNNIIFYVNRNKPKNFLINFKNLTYNSSFSSQPDFENALNKAIENSKLKKLACIKSKDSITQILIEQFLKEKNNNGLKAKFFDNEDSAKNWLAQIEN